MPTASCFATAERKKPTRKNGPDAEASDPLFHFLFFGAAGRIRTHDPLVRSSVGARKLLILNGRPLKESSVTAPQCAALYRSVPQESPTHPCKLRFANSPSWASGDRVDGRHCDASSNSAQEGDRPPDYETAAAPFNPRSRVTRAMGKGSGRVCRNAPVHFA